MAARTYRGLDALRFVAAAIVVATHATFYISERFQPGFPLWPNGARGVDIFFVISGFVIVASSSKFIGVQGSWKTFVKRRIDRIVPMYWLMTTVKLILLILAGSLITHSSLDWPMIARSYLFLPSRKIDGSVEPLLGVGWTLVFEAFFYTIFALALYIRHNIYLVTLPILTLVSFLGLFRPHNYPAWMFYFNSIVLEFAMGMFIAELIRRRAPAARMLGGAALILGLTLLLVLPDSDTVPRFVNIGIPSALLVYGAASTEEGLGSRAPTWLVTLGRASYSIYLVHPLVAPAGAFLAHRLGIHSGVIASALCWVIGIAVGTAAYFLVEERIVSYQRRTSMPRPRPMPS